MKEPVEYIAKAEETTEQGTTLRLQVKELVEYIAKAIVNLPDKVEVIEETTEQGTTLRLQVADEDKGRIIGKQGRVAEAIRTLLRVKAAKAGTRVNLEIV